MRHLVILWQQSRVSTVFSVMNQLLYVLFICFKQNTSASFLERKNIYFTSHASNCSMRWERKKCEQEAWDKLKLDSSTRGVQQVFQEWPYTAFLKSERSSCLPQKRSIDCLSKVEAKLGWCGSRWHRVIFSDEEDLILIDLIESAVTGMA